MAKNPQWSHVQNDHIHALCWQGREYCGHKHLALYQKTLCTGTHLSKSQYTVNTVQLRWVAIVYNPLKSPTSTKQRTDADRYTQSWQHKWGSKEEKALTISVYIFSTCAFALATFSFSPAMDISLFFMEYGGMLIRAPVFFAMDSAVEPSGPLMNGWNSCSISKRS